VSEERGGDAVVNQLLPSVRARYAHIQTNQEDWGWFIEELRALVASELATWVNGDVRVIHLDRNYR
jgi:hypothetical protein